MAVPKLWSKSTNVSAGQSRFCSSSRVHDLAGMLEEHPKEPERLLLKFHLQAVLAQLTRAKVNLKDPEADGSTVGSEVDRFPSRTWLECSAPSGRGQAWTGLPHGNVKVGWVRRWVRFARRSCGDPKGGLMTPKTTTCAGQSGSQRRARFVAGPTSPTGASEKNRALSPRLDERE